MRFRPVLLLAFLPSVALPLSAAATDIAPVPAPARARVASVRVAVAPDRADWTYTPGEPVTFHVAIIADQHPLENIRVTYTLGDEADPSAPIAATTDATGRLSIHAGTRSTPGFLRCIVSTEIGGRTYRGLATAGFAPESIEPTQRLPDDFDTFWDEQKALLAAVPLEPHITLVPEACTDRINVYDVSIRTLGSDDRLRPPPRIYGVLCEPKQPSRYPALLRVPGAGVRPYQGLRDLAANGVITLEIGIHGIPTNLDPAVYDQLRVGALDGYWTFNIHDRERYTYRRVILGALRANDFLTSLPNWDGRHLAVGGESQGGMLAIATAALDPRVTRLHAIVPAMADHSGPLHDRPGGWPHLLKEPDSPFRNEAVVRTLQYYDTVNFARRVTAPGIYAWGYNDEVCPPTSMFSVYHAITAPKRLVLALDMGHRTLPEVYRTVDRWILEGMGIEPNEDR